MKILFDEFHVSVYPSRALSRAQVSAAYRSLGQKRFVAEPAEAVRRVFHRRAPLRSMRIKVSR